MFSGFTLFPTQASTLAPEVDNLYLGVVAITAFFAIVVVVWNVFSDGPVMLTVIFGVCGVLALGSAAINGRE